MKTKKKKKKAKRKKRKLLQSQQKKSGGGGGLAAIKEISPELADFLGKGNQMARTDIVKQLWQYIREHELQNPENKREIILDVRMKAVFGCDRFTMFTMNKYLGAHIHPYKPVDLTENSTKKPKKRKATPKDKKEKKKRKGGNAGLQAPYQLSPELARVVGRQILPRPQVTKKLWQYIKANDLQNPEDKREILCDQKLKLVMGGEDTVTMFTMNKHISPHLLEKLDPSYYVPSDKEEEPNAEAAEANDDDDTEDEE